MFVTRRSGRRYFTLVNLHPEILHPRPLTPHPRQQTQLPAHPLCRSGRPQVPEKEKEFRIIGEIGLQSLYFLSELVATSHVSLSCSCRINAPRRYETRALIGWEASQEKRPKTPRLGVCEWMLDVGIVARMVMPGVIVPGDVFLAKHTPRIHCSLQ